MPSKYNIKCHTYSNTGNEFFVTAESKVWPCSNYSNSDLDPVGVTKNFEPGERITDDEYLVELIKDNPDWNNLDATPLEDIVSHDFFVNRVSPVGWHSDNPPTMCVALCNKKVDSTTE